MFLRCLACLLLMSTASIAEPLERWNTYEADSTEIIDHQAWATFLDRYVITDDAGLNRVRYGAVTDGDRKLLKGYLGALQATKVSTLNRDEQMAYWINLYNATTVDLILTAYPVDSIRHVGGSWLSPGPWRNKLLVVEGEELSLDDIEHGILRPLWADARVHYAVNCASVGCPNLQKTPFEGAEIDQQLTAAAQEYVASNRGVVSVNGSSATLSKIYSWFNADFGTSHQNILEHVRKYATGDKQAALKDVTVISGFDYDWALNGAE